MTNTEEISLNKLSYVSTRKLTPLETLIIVIPGGPGLASNYLQPFAQSLSNATQTNTLVLDLPSHGTHDHGKLNFIQTSNLINETLHYLSLSHRLVTIGHSFGASLLFEALLGGKVSIDRYIFLNLATSLLPSDYYKSKISELLGSNLKFEINTEEDFKKYWRNILPVYFYGQPNLHVVDLLSMSTCWLRNQTQTVGITSLVGMSPLKSSLRTVPILSISCTNDYRAPNNNAADIEALFQEYETIRLPDTGHFPMLEKPKELLHIIKKFINSK